MPVKFFKSCTFIIAILLIFLTSCFNTDYLNKNISIIENHISSSEIFSNLSKELALPNFNSLNEDQLLNLYAIDPKILLDYVANIPNDNISGTEISIFRLKNLENIPEVTLGIERRIEILKDDFINNKQFEYDLIKNPYIKVFNNYVIFALYKDITLIDKILSNIFN